MHDDLPEDELKKRLGNFKESPDEGLWKRIQAGKPSGDINIADKLKAYEEKPDNIVWNNIRTEIYRQRFVDRLDVVQHVLAVATMLLLIHPGLFQSFEKMEKQKEALHIDTLSLRLYTLKGADTSANENIKKGIYDNAERVERKNSKAVNSNNRNDNSSAYNDSRKPGVIDRSRKAIDLTKESAVKRKYSNGKSEKISDSTNVFTISEDVSIVKKEYRANGVVTADNTALSSGEKLSTSGTTAHKERFEHKLQMQSKEKANINHNMYLKDTVINKSDFEERLGAHILNNIHFTSEQDNKFKDGVIQDSVQKNDSVSREVAHLSTNKADTLVARKIIIQDDKEERNQHFSLYVLVMPTLGYQQIKPVKDDGILVESIDKLSAFSPKRLGIRAEFGVEKKLSDKVALDLGLVYFQRKQTLQYRFRSTAEVEVTPINPGSLEYDISMGNTHDTYEYELKNLGMLAGLNYTIKARSWMQMVGLAAELHRNLSKSNGQVYLFGNVYYRVSRQISRQFHLIIQPTVNYSLNMGKQVGTPFYVKPYGLGLNFGVYYRFE